MASQLLILLRNYLFEVVHIQSPIIL